MPRDHLRYGHRITLFCDPRSGFCATTSSALSPLGVFADSKIQNFEHTVFEVCVGDGDVFRHRGEPVKFGSTLRLRHIRQGKYLCHQSRYASVVDRANQRVTLEDLAAMDDSMWEKWRLMPRYKVRAEGEFVMEGDYVTLQVTSGDHNFLHVSRLRDSGIDGGFEVNAGSTPETFSIRIHDADVRPPRNIHGYVVQEVELRCGDCIELHHKEDRTRLVAPPSGPCYFEPQDSAPRVTGSGSLPNSYRFVVEREDRHRGGILLAGDLHTYRLKDLRSGRYLSASHGSLGQPTLYLQNVDKEPTGNGAVFSFHDAVGEQDKELVQCSKVYLQIRDTEDSWLAAGEQLASGTRNTRRQRVVRCVPSLSPGDGLELHRISAEDHNRLNIILMLLPPIASVAELSDDGSPRGNVDWNRVLQIQENISQLNNICATSFRAQQLLHDLGVASLSLKLCQRILEHCTPDQLLSNDPVVDDSEVRYSDAFEVLKQAFTLISNIVRGNETHVADIRDGLLFLVDAACFCPEAAMATLECLRGNMSIVDTPNDSSLVDYVCDRLLSTPVKPLYDILAALATCGNKGLRSAQRRICSNLLKDARAHSRVFLSIKCDADVAQIGIPTSMTVNDRSSTMSASFSAAMKASSDTFALPMMTEVGDPVTWMPLTRLETLLGSHPRYNKLLELITSQVHCLAALCTGRNNHAVAAIGAIVSLEAIIPCISTPEVPARLRSAFLHLFTTGLVETEGSPDLVEMCAALFYIIEEPSTLPLEHDTPPSLQSTKEAVLGIVQTIVNSTQPITTRDLRLLLAAVNTMSSFLRRGMFRFTEYNALVALVSRLLVTWSVKEVTEKPLTTLYGVGSPQDEGNSTQLINEVRLKCISMVDHLMEFLLCRDAIDVVFRFTRGVKLGEIAQVADLDALRAVDGHLITGGETGPTTSLVPTLLRSLILVANTECTPVAVESIRLFWKLTNYPGQIIDKCGELQLLATAKSGQYFRQAKVHCDILADLASSTLSVEQAPQCHNAVDATDRLLSSPYGGTFKEKLSMMKHLRVVQSLLSICASLPMPPPEQLTELSTQIVSLLTTLCQDDDLAELIVNDIHKVLHLLTADIGVVMLLKALYFSRPFAATIAPVVIREIVSTLGIPSMALTTVRLLTGIVSSKDDSERYVNAVQDAIWRSIIMNPAVTPLFRFKERWCGSRGRPHREQVFSSSAFFNSQGELQLHVESVNLVYVLVKRNEVTRYSEVRQLLFGSNATDEIIEVVANATLPVFFRTKYVLLLGVLILRDKTYRGAFYGHRNFSGFVERCRCDVALLRQALGDEATSAQPLGPQPSSAVEHEIHQSRNSRSLIIDHVFNNVCMVLKEVFERVDELGGAILSAAALNAVIAGLIGLVDELCLLVRFVFIQQHFKTWPEIAASAKGRRRLVACLKVAKEHSFCGSPDWAADFDKIIDAVDNVSKKSDSLLDDDGDLPRNVPDHADAKSTLAYQASVAQRWKAYYEAIELHPACRPDNLFVSAAGFLLRTGLLGSQFLCSCVQHLPNLNRDTMLHTMICIRQCLLVEASNPFDESTSWADYFGVAKPPGYASDLHALSLMMPLAERQNAVVGWGRIGIAVLPTIFNQLSTQDDDLFNATLRLAIASLEGGNKTVQDDLFRWMASRTDEPLLIVMRDRLVSFRDAMNDSKKSIAAGASSAKVNTEGSELLLRLMHLCCEGHNLELQNYLRQQPDNVLSVNTLEAVAALLTSMLGIILPSTMGCVQQLLLTIAEAIQGPCPKNQDLFVALGIGDALASLLAVMSDDVSHHDLRQVHLLAVTVLLSLLERRTDATFVAPLVQSLSLSSLVRAMDRSYGDFSRSQKNSFVKDIVMGGVKRVAEHDDELTVGTQVLIFLRTCLDIQSLSHLGGSTTTEFTDKFNLTIRQALRGSDSFKEVNDLLGSIEILRDGIVERIYFRIPRISSANLREDSKQNLIKSVERDSDNKRIQDFFDRSKKLIEELEYYDRLRTTPGLAAVHEHAGKLAVLSMLAAIVLNVFLIATVRAPITLTIPAQTSTEVIFTQVFGILQVVSQTLLFLHFFFGPMKVFLNDEWGHWQDELNSDAVRESRSYLNIAPPQVSDNRVAHVPLIVYFSGSISMLLKSGVMWFRLIFLLAAFAGYFWTPEWYSVQLLQIVAFSPQLFNVVLAVTKNGTSLILTFILQLVVVYIFSIIAFHAFGEFYNDAGENFSCHTLLQCWLIHINNGLRAGGGIADDLPNPNYKIRLGYGRFFFDVLFFLIVIIIFLNIVFGIIVDTFAELREQREFVETDQESKCFVCGIDSNEFDRVDPGGFEHHVKAEHNMWNYVFFMHFLKMKPRDELNGAEDYCLSRIEDNDYSFFPMGRASTLDRAVAHHGSPE